MNSLLTRFISAVVLATLCIVVIFIWKAQGLLGLTTVFVGIGSFELMQILFPSEKSKSRVPSYLFLGTVWTMFAIIAFGNRSPLEVLQGGCILYIISNLWLHRKSENIKSIFQNLTLGLMGITYMCLYPASAIEITRMENGVELFLFFLGIVVAGDIGAYLMGVYFGKIRIAPFISPKKSLEGMMGGLTGSFLIGALFAWYHPQQEFWKFLALSLTTGLVGQFGDFFESLLKRVADVKDSGSIMPGHGGVLDRIDGILFACPVFLFGIRLFYQ